MEVYEGLPDRLYEVVGLIDVYDNKPFFFSDSATKQVLDYAQKNNANALVWLSKRVVMSGSLGMDEANREPATPRSPSSRTWRAQRRPVAATPSSIAKTCGSSASSNRPSLFRVSITHVYTG
jgi:hypothetical protein